MRLVLRKLILIYSLSLSFYHAMHYSAKRGLAITCRLSVRPSVRLWRWWIMTTTRVENLRN